jgi:hypothetical protein
MGSMPQRFDIFRAESGAVRWLEAANDLDTARARVQSLGPGQYVIYDYETRDRVSMTVPEEESPTQS